MGTPAVLCQLLMLPQNNSMTCALGTYCALVSCLMLLLVPHVVQSSPRAPVNKHPYQPAYTSEPSYEESTYVTEAIYKGQEESTFAAVLIGGCDKCRGIEASEVYSPNVKSSTVPVSPFDTCTLPAGVFYNDSLIVCGGGCQATGTLCYTNKIGCNTWEPMTPMKEYRERFTMTVIESCNALVVVGGFRCTNDIEIFNNGKWIAGPKHDGVHGLVSHSAVSYDQSQVMVIGGILRGKPTNNVFTIDVSNGRVEKAACLNSKRYSHASLRASWGGNDYIIVAGGFVEYCVSNTVEYIKASTDGYKKPTWKKLAPMNINRYDFGLALYGSQIAAIGGQPPIESEQIEVYDPVTNCWKMTGESIAHPEIQFFTTITVPDSYLAETTTVPPYTTPAFTNKPYPTAPSYPVPYQELELVTYPEPENQEFATVLVGGCDGDLGIKSSEVYSPNYASSIIPSAPFTTCVKPAGVYYNGSLIVCGGGEQGVGTSCFSNAIGSSKWVEMCSMKEHRDRFTMTVVADALVVIGGFTAGADVEIYKNGHWEYGPELKKKKGLIHHCSASYGDDEVVVTGGFCDGKQTDSVQSINVRTHEVKRLPSLLKKRYHHACISASVNNQKAIIVAGGFEDFTVCNTVEYYSFSSNSYVESKWKNLASMNIRRYDFGLTMYGNKIAAFGGQPTIDSEKIEQYCPDTDTWTFVGRDLVQPERHFFAAISVPEVHFKPVQYSFTEGYGAPKSTYSPISNGYTETYTQSPSSYIKVSTDGYDQPSYPENTDGYINKYSPVSYGNNNGYTEKPDQSYGDSNGYTVEYAPQLYDDSNSYTETYGGSNGYTEKADQTYGGWQIQDYSRKFSPRSYVNPRAYQDK